MKTLAVEDVCMMRKLLEKLLSPFGACDSVENGTEALIKFSHTCLNEEKYDVIFLDLMLPEISGEDVLREIRDIENNLGIKKEERVKIIICSALSDYENVIKIVKKHCDAYISKPFYKQIIYKTLKQLKLIKSKEIKK
jgi:two-component system, chemotaxis family, chemotaxis protein CheY